jgi:hypothetical protein
MFAKSRLASGNYKNAINNVLRQQSSDDMSMAVMNGIKGPAIEAKFQWVLLIETKYDVEQEDKDAKGCDSECNW